MYSLILAATGTPQTWYRLRKQMETLTFFTPSSFITIGSVEVSAQGLTISQVLPSFLLISIRIQYDVFSFHATTSCLSCDMYSGTLFTNGNGRSVNEDKYISCSYGLRLLDNTLTYVTIISVVGEHFVISKLYKKMWCSIWTWTAKIKSFSHTSFYCIWSQVMKNWLKISYSQSVCTLSTLESLPCPKEFWPYTWNLYDVCGRITESKSIWLIFLF